MRWSLAVVLVLCLTRVACAQTLILQWDPAPQADTYRLYYGQASGAYDVMLETGAATMASIGDLAVGTVYFFAATALNAHGESAYSNEIQALIEAPAVDTMPPTVEITSPINGATVRRNRTVTIRVDAADETALVRVDIYVNGVWLCNDPAPPHTCPWRVPNQRRTFQLHADAVDGVGHLSSSDVTTVQSR